MIIMIIIIIDKCSVFLRAAKKTFPDNCVYNVQ